MAKLGIKGFRWAMIGLLMPGSIIHFLTRCTVPVAGPGTQHDPAVASQQRVLESQPAQS